MRWNVGRWICEECFEEMEITHVGANRNEVHCPNCGNTWYVDNDGEYINE